MTSYAQPIIKAPILTWRKLEWGVAGLAITLQAGAFLPLMMSSPDGSLGDSARTKLSSSRCRSNAC